MPAVKPKEGVCETVPNMLDNSDSIAAGMETSETVLSSAYPEGHDVSRSVVWLINWFVCYCGG